ncbi:CD63 antigen-like isoform X2 [Bombus pyrosoma]|uniref:CD63 antigen-like isoform X2 n=1 Tax=Bombus pyrosoma TaxID=396416 RepID=UPI001CB9A8EB|nr:CD63 antigen-like isoform X2 [Bombus pyrosoma]
MRLDTQPRDNCLNIVNRCDVVSRFVRLFLTLVEWRKYNVVRCVKYLMFIFNLLFVITGIILLSIGIGIHGVYRSYQHFLDNKFLSVPSLLIAIGAIIFFIAFFGCCGAVRESYCMIVTFTSLLVVVFILEFSGGISGYVLRARASLIIQNKMQDSMQMYKNSSEVLTVWDNLQRDFDCCGTINASDWVTIGHMDKTDIPASCCINEAGVEPKNCSLTSAVVHQGCYNKFLSFVKSHAMQLGGVGLGIAFVQAMGICFSVFLARSIRNSYESV